MNVQVLANQVEHAAFYAQVLQIHRDNSMMVKLIHPQAAVNSLIPMMEAALTVLAAPPAQPPSPASEYAGAYASADGSTRVRVTGEHKSPWHCRIL